MAEMSPQPVVHKNGEYLMQIPQREQGGLLNDPQPRPGKRSEFVVQSVEAPQK
jgi:hypothetical protein